MVPAEDESAFGRAWTYQELTIKSFEDLHRLWYTCMMERNRTYTRKGELDRMKAGYGGFEADERIEAVSAIADRDYTLSLGDAFGLPSAMMVWGGRVFAIRAENDSARTRKQRKFSVHSCNLEHRLTTVLCRFDRLCQRYAECSQIVS